ncbi:hypothetical protein SAMN05518672_1011257 [Chitinophaga sp. CF118]|uniref:hypothetical protein n=1 Tax=Chitinophaga sp. CF118 TaxID=1884367 RepID=UPI0008E2FC48|nr:hypothetical protein [Chitinophaga sp. CF118]SFD24862.1 hypothetical protein SAMN05518672_1011257 [Chitinophaga sp. CF118]
MKHFYTFRLLFLVTLLGIGSPSGHAQQGGDADVIDKIRALQVAYLSQKLDLTPDEAQKFWPLYNQYTKEVELLIAERQRRNISAKKADPQNKIEAGDNELGYERRMLDIKTHYDKEFQKVLPTTKASSVFRTEREFRSTLVRSLKERQNRNVGGPGARRFRQ